MVQKKTRSGPQECRSRGQLGRGRSRIRANAVAPWAIAVSIWSARSGPRPERTRRRSWGPRTALTSSPCFRSAGTDSKQKRGPLHLCDAWDCGESFRWRTSASDSKVSSTRAHGGCVAETGIISGDQYPLLSMRSGRQSRAAHDGRDARCFQVHLDIYQP